jgi:hypothetical protein
MDDIAERLRHWSHGLTYDPAAGLMHEAAAEIERLRNGAAASRENEHYRGVEELGRPRRAHNPEIAGSNPAAPSHEAAPEARADSDEARTDKAAASHRREGTGNTPSEAEIDALEFVVDAGGIANGWDKDILRQWLMRLRPEFYSAEAIKEGESDRPQPIGSPAKTNPTPMRNGTPAEGSVHGEGTVGQRLVGRLSITQAMLDDNEKLRSEIARLREAIRRLAEQDATLSVCDGTVTVTMDGTLTDEEKRAVGWAAEMMEVGSLPNSLNRDDARTLRALLERLK